MSTAIVDTRTNSEKYTDEAAEFLMPFFPMGEMDILNKFKDLSDKSIIKECKDPKKNYVFVPGTRKDKVLLVAHVDTVWDEPVDVKYNQKHGILYSGKAVLRMGRDGFVVGGIGIGADDRAGVAALWYLKDSGHSLLLLNGEEIGCIGSNKLMSNPDMANLVNDHQFMIQFDRRGDRDLVFYHVGTKAFSKFMVRHTRYTVEQGSFTDICVLARDIPGVNISTGYYNEHRATEILKVDEWWRTVSTVENLLSMQDLPKFTL